MKSELFLRVWTDGHSTRKGSWVTGFIFGIWSKAVKCTKIECYINTKNGGMDPEDGWLCRNDYIGALGNEL